MNFDEGVLGPAVDLQRESFMEVHARNVAAGCAPAYHVRPIPKGVLGGTSKIVEELAELKDAEAQDIRILCHCELADLYGALRARAERYGLNMRDLERMADATARAFEAGERT